MATLQTSGVWVVVNARVSKTSKQPRELNPAYHDALSKSRRRHFLAFLARRNHSTEPKPTSLHQEFTPPKTHHKNKHPPQFHSASAPSLAQVRPRLSHLRLKVRQAMEANQSAGRAARRFLDERVRSNWEWPNTPDYWSASDEEVRGVTEYRERYYGDSSPESSDNEDAADPYKFDSPDSIGDAVEQKSLRRKRKRSAEIEEEMMENEGLRMWVERRDAWTGVASVKKYGTKRPAKRPPAVEGESSSTTPTLLSTSETSAPPSPDYNIPASNEPLVPVAHPLLPDNAIRKSITSRTYADIYTKIVMSSRTPAVPVNLADMTKALVQGWQENGEWPPKAAPLDPLAGKKRAAVLAGPRTDIGTDPFLSHHPHLQKGMDSVKRMFHLTGHHNGMAKEG